MLHRRQYSTGFNLIELMVAMAIVTILAAIAIPAYNAYVHTARMAEGKESIATLHLAQVEYFEENGFFFTGADTAAIVADPTVQWRPSPWDPTLNAADNIANLNFTYSVDNCVLGGGGNGAVDGAGQPTECYTVNAVGKGMLTANDVLSESN